MPMELAAEANVSRRTRLGDDATRRRGLRSRLLGQRIRGPEQLYDVYSALDPDYLYTHLCVSHAGA
jgi:hypothetical protein